MIEVSWTVVVFIVISLGFVILAAKQDDYHVGDFRVNPMPFVILFLWLFFAVIWGGIFWW